MPESAVKRWWDSIKPPPAVRKPADDPASRAVKARQRRLIRLVLLAGVTGALAWQAYAYWAGAQGRAQQAFQQGLTRMGQNDPRGAEERFTKAIGIWPQMAPAYFERGLARHTMQQTDAAKEDFEAALSKDPTMAEAHTEIGLIYRERGDVARATKEFDLSISVQPTMDALYQRGQLYESLGQHEKAIADYDEAIHQRPDAPFVYDARALARDAAGDHDGAAEDRLTAAKIVQP